MHSQQTGGKTDRTGPPKAFAPMDRGKGRTLRIVALGGGTGLATLLTGLKKYVGPQGPLEPEELTALVTVTDDGGSSGRLRRDFRMLPPGDIRNCMVALSEDAALLARLFRYRFASGRGLKGHSFGNLFLTALTHVTGDFAEAVKLSSEVLAIRGQIFPSTTQNVTLRATLEDVRRVDGETRITASKGRIRRIELVPPNARPLPEALRAVEEADLITIGPGSLFTSMIPNLLVRGMAKKIRQSKATKVFICNLMTQPHESIGLTAAQHVEAIHDHAGGKLINWVVLNGKAVSPALLEKYRRQGADQVRNDLEALDRLGVGYIVEDLLVEDRVARHDPDKLAQLLLLRIP
ncbi:MAG TPA: YvcK family protein [Candidatus Acidoferrales bacterium]